MYAISGGRWWLTLAVGLLDAVPVGANAVSGVSFGET